MTDHEIRFNCPDISADDRAFLADAIAGGHTSGNGAFTQRTEKMLEATLGVRRALLTTSCTHALEMSALLSRLEPGDEVIVPSYTFVSTASAFAIFGAVPVFVDSRPDTLNINTRLVDQAITSKTRAIYAVHYGGVACEMEDLTKLTAKHNLTLIEDNAHGLFAKYKGKYLGSFGAMATQSFHETKNITCGEGGALLINNHSLIERGEILREKGTNRSSFLRGQVDRYTWVDIGSSWVLSDLLAAILWGQMQRVNEINTKRVEIWNRYHTQLSTWAGQHGVQLPVIPDGCEHVGHVYHIRFETGDQRTRFIDHMKARQISCVFHYQPLHSSPVGQQFGGRVGQCPVAEHAGKCLVRLPLFNTLTKSDQDYVIENILSFNT